MNKRHYTSFNLHQYWVEQCGITGTLSTGEKHCTRSECYDTCNDAQNADTETRRIRVDTRVKTRYHVLGKHALQVAMQITS